MLVLAQRKFCGALTWLCLLLHVFAGTGMAQGAVICIVQDDHIALEPPHPYTGCLAIQKDRRPTPLEMTLESPTSHTCRDTPIFGAGSHLTVLSSVERPFPPAQLSVLPSPPKVESPDGPTLQLQNTAIALRSLHESLRSVILLV